MRAIVTGMIATYPVGGVVWDYGQYALGLERMGWDVWYLEDTGMETYDPGRREYGENCDYAVGYLSDALAKLSPTLGSRWHFRAVDGRTYGIPKENFDKIVRDTDLFLNVSGGTLLRDEYLDSPCKVLIDSDPGWNHFVNYPKWDAQPGWQGAHGFRAHDRFFTYAERIGTPACILPPLGLKWQPTRPPVVIDQWKPDGHGVNWTTVMTWNNFGRKVEYNGMTFGTKEMEFGKVEDLPARTRVALELATGGQGAPVERWRSKGWRVTDSHSVSTTADVYRSYIQQSRGELSVAKNLYVATHSGWFSCRSVCYLASGRPVVIQDTGFSESIPTGRGLFAFRDLESAVTAIEQIEGDYAAHSRYARQIAAEYFDARVVLGQLLRDAGLG